MNYEDFKVHLESKCLYETIYMDSEGREILVIGVLDAFVMTSRLSDAARKEERENAALEVERLGMLGYGSLAIAAGIRKGNIE